MCRRGREDAKAEARDEEVVPCTHEEGGDYDEDCLEGVGWLFSGSARASSLWDEMRKRASGWRARAIEVGFLIETVRTA